MSKVIVTTAATTGGHALPLDPNFLIFNSFLGQIWPNNILPPCFLFGVGGISFGEMLDPGSATGNGSRSCTDGGGLGDQQT